eukprot:scaffold2959_cov388-Prasinococcus_capsulatus_cf.AAC.4
MSIEGARVGRPFADPTAAFVSGIVPYSAGRAGAEPYARRPWQTADGEAQGSPPETVPYADATPSGKFTATRSLSEPVRTPESSVRVEQSAMRSTAAWLSRCPTAVFPVTCGRRTSLLGVLARRLSVTCLAFLLVGCLSPELSFFLRVCANKLDSLSAILTGLNSRFHGESYENDSWHIEFGKGTKLLHERVTIEEAMAGEGSGKNDASRIVRLVGKLLHPDTCIADAKSGLPEQEFLKSALSNLVYGTSSLRCVETIELGLCLKVAVIGDGRLRIVFRELRSQAKESERSYHGSTASRLPRHYNGGGYAAGH